MAKRGLNRQENMIIPKLIGLKIRAKIRKKIKRKAKKRRKTKIKRRCLRSPSQRLYL